MRDTAKPPHILRRRRVSKKPCFASSKARLLSVSTIFRLSKNLLRRMHSRPPCVKGAVKSAPKADLTGGLLGKMLRIFRNYMQLGNIFRTTPPSAYSADTVESQPSATLFLKYSAGVFQPRHFLGRLLIRSSTT